MTLDKYNVAPSLILASFGEGAANIDKLDQGLEAIQHFIISEINRGIGNPTVLSIIHNTITDIRTENGLMEANMIKKIYPGCFLSTKQKIRVGGLKND